MLLVPFQLGGEHYALPAADIVAITQVPHLRTVPQAPAWVKGLLRYQGAVLPVVDLSALLSGTPCRNWLSTRLMLLGTEQNDNQLKPVIALMAERVTATLTVDPNTLADSGVHIEDAPWLGSVVGLKHALLQIIKWKPLLTDELEQLRLKYAMPD